MKTDRLLSLDALRGLDMLFICGLNLVVQGFCLQFPGGADWSLYRQFEHVKWEGLRFFDLIFPLFIFIAGISFPFSLARQREKGMTHGQIHLKILKRLVLLVLLGLVYNGQVLAGNFAKFHSWSILGIIGVAWATAAVLYVNFSSRTRLVASTLMLSAFYVLLCIPAPDAPAGTSSYVWTGCMLRYFDAIGIPSWLVTSSFSYSFSASLGMLAGDIVRNGEWTGGRKTLCLLALGAGLLLVGWAVSFSCPLVKNIWTPSYALVCGGVAFIAFAAFYWLIDVKGVVAWSKPLAVVGMNAIAAYMLDRFVKFDAISEKLVGVFAKMMPDPSFIIAVGHVALLWIVLWYLKRNRTYLKV